MAIEVIVARNSWLLHWNHNSFVFNLLLVFFKYFSKVRIKVDREWEENAKIRNCQIAFVKLKKSVKFSFVTVKVEKWCGFTKAGQFRADSIGKNAGNFKKQFQFSTYFS